jgi:NADPH:quinone reductase-like Zn-dependent oxidoreductase
MCDMCVIPVLAGKLRFSGESAVTPVTPLAQNRYHSFASDAGAGDCATNPPAARRPDGPISGRGSMKAYVYRRYGGPEVLELVDLPKPTPKDDEVLVRILATTVTAGDWRVRTLDVPRGLGLIARLMLGVTRPRQPILGTELAGTIETIGNKVTRFRPGDAVFAFPGLGMRCHAEYRTIAETGPIVLKPDNLSFEEAASLPFGGSTALDFLRRAGIRAGDKMLVIGASGAVGTALVQLARHFGASVTGVTSAGNLDLVASLGADRVIDYGKQDFLESPETYDLIADTVGATSFARCKHALREKGRLLKVAGGLSDLFSPLWASMTGNKRVIAGQAEERPEYVQQLADLAKAGALRPVIDRRYDFAQMAEAHAYVETRLKRGSVVVRVEHTD